MCFDKINVFRHDITVMVDWALKHKFHSVPSVVPQTLFALYSASVPPVRLA